MGRTVLILKNKDIGLEVVTNYRPITCFFNIWKLITSVVSKATVLYATLTLIVYGLGSKRAVSQEAEALRTIF